LLSTLNIVDIGRYPNIELKHVLGVYATTRAQRRRVDPYFGKNTSPSSFCDKILAYARFPPLMESLGSAAARQTGQLLL